MLFLSLPALKMYRVRASSMTEHGPSVDFPHITLHLFLADIVNVWMQSVPYILDFDGLVC